MPVRSTMANLITRERVLINDPSGASQVFDDQTIQDILDARRIDVLNGSLIEKPTFSGSTVQYLDYFSDWSDWEDSPVLKQYLTVVVTPSTSENIVGTGRLRPRRYRLCSSRVAHSTFMRQRL